MLEHIISFQFELTNHKDSFKSSNIFSYVKRHNFSQIRISTSILEHELDKRLQVHKKQEHQIVRIAQR
ncbi:hypothetical protein LguiA_002693 [Lonicera macranthoides]